MSLDEFNCKEKATVDIVIVNWNSGDLLKRCLRSISGHPPKICEIKKIVIVDNGSMDGSMKGINEKSMPLQLIFNNKNNGFASACNTGAANCSSKYLLFLNPDARFHKGVLDSLITFLESNESKEFGICGPRLITDTGEISRTCARFPTLKTMIATSTGLDRIGLGGIKSFHMWDWDHCNSRTVDHVIGAFFLVKTLLFQKLKGFDERFFVYLEDLDFSLRARRMGYRSYYHAGAIAFHEGGGVQNRSRPCVSFIAGEAGFFLVSNIWDISMDS